MGTCGSVPGSRRHGGGGGRPKLGGTLTTSGDELRGDEGCDVVVLPRDALRWPCRTLCIGERVGLSPPSPHGADTPFASPPPHPPPIPVPWPSASRLLRWQSGHSWKPHLAQLQWELKKPRWQASQSWGAPSPRFQAVTPAGNTALSLPCAPSVTPPQHPGPHLPSGLPGAPSHASLSLRTASQKGSPRTPSKYLARQRLLPALLFPRSGPGASSCSVSPSASPKVQKPSTLSSPPSPKANLGERRDWRGCSKAGRQERML